MLATAIGLTWLFGPLWLSVTLAWWRSIAPPRIPLARLYMAVGAVYSVGGLVVGMRRASEHCGCEVEQHLAHQHLGAVVIIAAMYVELLVGWRRGKPAELVIPEARLVRLGNALRRKPRAGEARARMKESKILT